MSGACRQEIRVERNDYIGLVQVIDRVHRLSKRKHRSIVRSVAPARFVLVPLRVGELRQKRANLRGQSRRGHSLRQNPQSGPSRRNLRPHVAYRRQKCSPAFNAPFVDHCLRTVGIVQRQNRRLIEHVRSAQAAGMLRIALNLRGPPHVALDQQPGRNTRLRHGRGVEKRPARNNLLGRPHVRNDFLRRQFRAGAQPGHRRRRSHQFQHPAPVDSRGFAFRILGEFVFKLVLILRRFRQLIQALPESLSAVVRDLGLRRGEIDRPVQEISRVGVVAHRYVFTGGTSSNSAGYGFCIPSRACGPIPADLSAPHNTD